MEMNADFIYWELLQLLEEFGYLLGRSPADCIA